MPTHGLSFASTCFQGLGLVQAVKASKAWRLHHSWGGKKENLAQGRSHFASSFPNHSLTLSLQVGCRKETYRTGREWKELKSVPKGTDFGMVEEGHAHHFWRASKLLIARDLGDMWKWKSWPHECILDFSRQSWELSSFPLSHPEPRELKESLTEGGDWRRDNRLKLGAEKGLDEVSNLRGWSKEKVLAIFYSLNQENTCWRWKTQKLARGGRSWL